VAVNVDDTSPYWALAAALATMALGTGTAMGWTAGWLVAALAGAAAVAAWRDTDDR
jgi:hypothetical protein